MHRIKLNDRMAFPEELDMSPFIDVEDEVRGAEMAVSLLSLLLIYIVSIPLHGCPSVVY